MRSYSTPDAEAMLRQIALEEGVDPAVFLSLWEQEGSKATNPALRGPTLPEGHKYAGHYGQGPFQIMSFHGPAPPSFEGQARWAAKHLKEKGVRGYYGQTAGGGSARPTGMPTFPSTDEFEAQVMGRARQAGAPALQLASAGVPDIQPGLLPPPAAPGGFSMSEQPMPLQPPMQERPQMDNPELLGNGTLEQLMGNPLFLMGASMLANRGNVGRGLLGGTAAWQAMRQGNEANALRRMQIQQMMNPRSANITELEYLQKLGVPRDQALRYAFSGQAGYGEQVNMAGKVPYVQVQNPDGTKSWRPLTEAELGQRQQVITEEERVGKAGQEYGKQTADLRKQVNDAAMILPESIKRTDELISELRSGKYADTGPVMGRIKELWDPDLAKLNLQAMEQALQNLQITNLAPVTVKELEMIQQMYAGSYKTPEQNAAVLEYLNKRMRERQRRMRLLDAKMRQPNFKIENLASWADELTPFEESVGEFAPSTGAAPAAPAPAPQIPATMQKKPEGMPDDVWQELLRLRGATGGY